MTEMNRTTFSARLKTAADARKALLASFRPKPAVVDTEYAPRDERRAAEREQVRQARVDAKAAKAQAVLDAAEAAANTVEALAEAALQARRSATKERKALTAAEQKAKRDLRYAARKARQ